MDTLRVNICYRPLRIGWAIKSDDFESYRMAIKYSYALWGGAFNPILFVDNERESSQLVEFFRLDMIVPIDCCSTTSGFLRKFSHLINPYFYDKVFMKGEESSASWSNVLDIKNALHYLAEKPEWWDLERSGICSYTWDKNDPLSDVFLSQLGAYPEIDEVGFDYLDYLKKQFKVDDVELDLDSLISTEVISKPSISEISSYRVEQHYAISTGFNRPGFFVGSVSNLKDLVCHWNLKACNIPIWFLDPEYQERYKCILPLWTENVRGSISHSRFEIERQIGIWTRWQNAEKALKSFSNEDSVLISVSEDTWNGRNIKSPMMYFGETTVLGVLSHSDGLPKVTFSLSDKPFSSDNYFYQQHLVASISFMGGLYGEEQITFQPPYIPELNEVYSREMHLFYNKLRIEPERVGIVIDAADHDSFLQALPTNKLITYIFNLIGYRGTLSNAGLITKQIIAQLGGIQGGRVTKIAGVRKLLKTHGPNRSFKKCDALQIINKGDSNRPNTRLANYNDIYIEPRQPGESLDANSVFGFLVEKGLYRIGSEIQCPSCSMKPWVPIDSLRNKIVCDLCGHEHDITRSLTNINQWHFRRSGILGVEKNMMGAVPVLLTLQQLDTHLGMGINKGIFSPSMDLSPISKKRTTSCETDFVWVKQELNPLKTVVILAECKDKGPIDIKDVNNLEKIADKFSRKRFDTFILLSKLEPFTKEEIEMAKALNKPALNRVILLTIDQLEPYNISSKNKDGKKLNWHSPKEMADSTYELYFKGND